METTIYHNPACSTSRTTLALLRHAGVEPRIVNYLTDPPTRARLRQLLHIAGLRPVDATRRKGTAWQELGLDVDSLDDDALLDAMVAHPQLIERPLVETPFGVRLCRPAERVLEILPPVSASFTEDG